MRPLLFFASLLILCCLCGYVTCAVVSLNTTTVAAVCGEINNCYFQDSFIWNDGIAPTTNDTVNIMAPPNTYLIYNESIILTNLTVQGEIIFVLLENAAISVQNLVLSGSNVLLILKEYAALVSQENTFLLDGAKMNTNEDSGFAQAGSQFFLGRESALFVYDQSYIGLHATSSYIYGELILSSSDSLFISTGDLYFENQRETNFIFAPIIYSVYFYSSHVTFQYGWQKGNFAYLESSNVSIYASSTTSNTYNNITVDSLSTLYLLGIPDCSLATPIFYGTLYISTSNVRITSSEIFNSPLVLAGDSDFYSDVVVLTNVKFLPGQLNETANVNIMADVLHVLGAFTIPGELYAYQYAYLSGTLNVTGSVTVSGDLYVDGVFRAGGAVNVGYGPMVTAPHLKFADTISSLSLSHANLSASTIFIGDNATITAHDSIVTGSIELFTNSTLEYRNSSFYGNIYNDGFVRVRGVLKLQGNFTQGKQGTFIIADIELANRTSGYVSAVGSVFIEGSILYSIRSAALNNQKMQLVVVEATQGVFGQFKSNPTNIGSLQNAAALTYTQNDVYLVFGSDPRERTLPWWVWLVAVLGIIVVVGLITFLYMTRHKRKGFEPVALG